MNFYDRYTAICTERGIEPCSQKAAEAFGVTRATISVWNKKNTAPKGETVKAIADVLGVSCDYLLGRTEDPTDYSNSDLAAEVAGPVLDYLDGDIKKAVDFHKAVDADVQKEKAQIPDVLKMYNKLDSSDKIKVEGIIQGLLLQDKYQVKEKLG